MVQKLTIMGILNLNKTQVVQKRRSFGLKPRKTERVILTDKVQYKVRIEGWLFFGLIEHEVA